MKRVITLNRFLNICTMQVCAVKDATNEEILKVCNLENPAGTTNGWTEVIRKADEESLFRGVNKLPVSCQSYPDRMHFLVLC